MKLSELIASLNEQLNTWGDIEVKTRERQADGYTWEDPWVTAVKPMGAPKEFIALN